MKKILVSLVIVLFTSVQEASAACWKKAYGRGAGYVLNSCPGGHEQNGALCYPHCNDGFYGVGPVCWQPCPSGFRDDGAFCAKPGPYGRGAGYAIWSEGKCNRENSQGCEKWGAMWYPRCREGFHAAGCCICSPNCVNGQTDIGVSCAKKSYGRGAGVPMICRSDQEQNGALCYPRCNSGYNGNGPVCWGSCPPGNHECGALCTDSQSDCVSKVLDITQNVIGLAVAIAATATGAIDIKGIIEGLGGTAASLSHAVCAHPALELMN